MDKFKIYYLNSKYYDYLNKNNFLDQMMAKEGRPHIGFIQLWTNYNHDFGYVIPLVTADNNPNQRLNKYQKLIEYEVNGQKQYSILKIDKMIPIINNADFVEKAEKTKLKNREIAQLKEVNNFVLQKEIFNLANDVREQRYSLNLNYFKRSKINDLFHSIDYPLADYLAINYAASLYQPTINELVIKYRDLGVESKLIERKYFRSDFDHISALKSAELNQKYLGDLQSNLEQKEKEILVREASSLKIKLHKYYLQSNHLNELENQALMAFWMQENKFTNNPKEFKAFKYESLNPYSKKMEEKEILNNSLTNTKFYFENEDLKIWYGWKNKEPNFRTIVIFNKHNNFAADSKSVRFAKNDSGTRELHLGLFEIFRSFPQEFKSIFDKYGYPYNQELLYKRQIDNINQQLDRYAKKPELLQKIENINDLINKLNNFKQMRQEQLIDIRRDWQIYLESQGLIDQNKADKENIFKFKFAPKNLKDNPTEQNNQTKKPSWLAKRETFIEDLIKKVEEDPDNWSWEKLWINAAPRNYTTDLNYSGWNSLFLGYQMQEYGWKDPRFITYNQAKKANIWIDTKNYKPIQLEKFIFEKEEKIIDAETNEEIRVTVQLDKPIVKTFYVYNVQACKDIKPLVPEIKPELQDPERDLIYEILKESSKAKVTEYAKVKVPYYSPKTDKIVVPEKWQYQNSSEKAPYQQINILVHEMSHSTGHKSRLNRWEDYSDHDHIFGSIGYAKEELVAQFSTIFTMKSLNLPTNQFEQQNDLGYIKSWKKVLRDHPNLFFQAIKEAEKSSDYLYKNYLATLDKLENKLKEEDKNEDLLKNKHSNSL